MVGIGARAGARMGTKIRAGTGTGTGTRTRTKTRTRTNTCYETEARN